MADLSNALEAKQPHYNQEPGNGRFFDMYQDELDSLFRMLDMPADASDNLANAVQATQPWAKGDHFKPDNPIILEGERQFQAREIYRTMGLVAAQPLEPGLYDQVIALGGTQRGNNMRLTFLAQTLSQGDVQIKEGGNVVLWGGQRAPFEALEEEPIRENLLALADTNHPARMNAWLGALDAERTELRNETDLMRLSALQHLGNLSLRKMHIRLGVVDSLISHYEFHGANYGVTLLNTAAVQRANGEPRHTTEACAEQWLNNSPPPKNAKIGFISSNPYIRRTALVVQRVATAGGRTDIEIVSAGPAAYHDAKDYLFLGEIARNLYEDSKSQADL